MGVAIAPVVLVHGGAGSIPQSMNEDKFTGMLKKKKCVLHFFQEIYSRMHVLNRALQIEISFFKCTNMNNMFYIVNKINKCVDMGNLCKKIKM